ncbi:hypothetical protein OW492_00730 [Psychromonas sp. 14N.309.X.WAT.B.A12]|uniref:hypothetical protein n=1 Tax=Psychromonas sp. 14N.309.X.WAT.B.A12 TaxID=2998322 RepID=UPI0025B19B7F|nr:hypothetical protein [Psychromonas sp. 14N.309.X.WAT.B.A12]MDN2661895.1 hypothetical protein [Psychromonas sp. 14N.309.X.WAT.B.A12]
MKVNIQKSIALLLIVGLSIQLSGCGTILKPERKGQSAGQLDASIVALNAIGLLFFLVPGVIAFAVDFNNGTIYLPGGSASNGLDNNNLVKIEGEVTNEKIQQAIFEHTGKQVDLNDDGIQTIANTGGDINGQLASM